MRQLSFKRHRFSADIIRHSVWLYARFTLSYRDVEEMLAERVSLPWEGSASELLAELELEVREKVRASRYWPGMPAQLANRLRRAAPGLHQIGIEVEFGDRASTKDRKRLVVIRRRGE